MPSESDLGMTSPPEENACFYTPKIAIPDVRVVIDSHGIPDSHSMSSLKDTSFHTLIILESSNPDTVHKASVALLHRETALALRYESIRMSATLNPLSSQYQVSDAGESGLRIFATVGFQRGECIIYERPLVVYPQLLPFHSGRPNGQQYPELNDAIERVPIENRDTFFRLLNMHVEEPSLAKGIIDTNTLFVGPLPGGPYHYAAVCKDVSRINHSCSPNVAYHFDLHSFSFSIRALFPIAPGEQVFISYIDPALPRAARQDALSSYHFACACATCSLSGPALAQSETRRALIARVDANAGVWDAALERWVRAPISTESTEPKYTSTVDKMYVDLFEKERLYYEPVWEAYGARLCKAACAVGDEEGAMWWAKLAAALSRAYTGEDRGWDAVAAALERADWWGVRAGYLGR